MEQPQEPEEIPNCHCGKPGTPLHSCPFRSDIHDDDSPHCHCCADCEQRCAEDI